MSESAGGDATMTIAEPAGSLAPPATPAGVAQQAADELRAEEQEIKPPLFVEPKSKSARTPGNMPPQRITESSPPPVDDEDDDESEEQPDENLSPTKKLRNENKNLRSRLRAAEEQAAKVPDLQISYDRLLLASHYGISPDDMDLIGSGSREEMEARAARVAALAKAQQRTTPPPSNRPVEGLRPGASPEPPKQADDSYPESWKPAHLRKD